MRESDDQSRPQALIGSGYRTSARPVRTAISNRSGLCSRLFLSANWRSRPALQPPTSQGRRVCSFIGSISAASFQISCPYELLGPVGCSCRQLRLEDFCGRRCRLRSGLRKKTEPPLPARRVLYPILGVLIVGLAVVPSYTDLKKASGLEAFKISSDSMCPIMRTGDRVISDSRAFQSRPPQRGDLIVFLFRPGATYTKRVIGIAGDVVSPGPEGTILVKGREFRPPPSCGSPDSATPSKLELRTDFASTVVPANSFFVVGDNLNASFDSRVPGFGPVTTAMLRGKPLFIWWSPTKARRGCQLH
jgi:signal peptidase I